MLGAYSSGSGGALTFSIDIGALPPPPLEVDVTISSRGSFNPRTGVVSLSMTITCSRLAYVDVFASLAQKKGRLTNRGGGGNSMECDGATTVRISVTGDSGPYVGGPAYARVSVDAYAPDGGYAQDDISRTVRLRGR